MEIKLGIVTFKLSHRRGLRKRELTNKSHEAYLICFSQLTIQSNLDHPDSLGLDKIVRIIEDPDNPNLMLQRHDDLE